MGNDGVWAIYVPCQWEFRQFVNNVNFSEQKFATPNGKTLYIFTETGIDKTIKFGLLDNETVSAYQKLNRCAVRSSSNTVSSSSDSDSEEPEPPEP